MRNLINMTNDQIEAAFDDMGGSCNMNIEYGSIDLVTTQDTIEQFVEAAKNYNDHGAIEKTENTLIIRNAQARKGDVRRDLYVIDFGSVRGCVH
jgi:Holliday junction resolvase-like predicted endonuclease